MRFLLSLFVVLAVTGPTSGLCDSGKPYRPLDHLWMGTRDIPDSRNFVILGAGTALTLGALAFDNDVKGYFKDRHRLGSASKLGNDYLGTGVPGMLIGLATLGYGLLRDQRHEIDAGESHLEGLLASAVYTTILKFSVRRQRPDSNNRQSFPSGHTSTTFTSAANMMEMYGPVAGVPALILASFTGVSRLDSNSHHLSDVLFGATLGYVVGRSYTFHHQQNESNERIALQPWYDDRSNWGVSLHVPL